VIDSLRARFAPGWVVKQPERPRATMLVLLVALLACLPDLRPVGLAVFAGLLGWGAWRLARATFRPATSADALMLAWTVAFGWIAVGAELLSLGRLLGQPAAWVGVGALCALAGIWLPAGGRRRPLPSARAAGRDLWAGLPWAARALLVAFGLHLATSLLLTFFAGINVYDSLSAYLPRAARMAQAGTVGAEMPYVGFLQYLPQVVAAIQFAFLRSDVLVNVFSFATAAMAALGVFALARSLLPAPARHGWPPLAAALAPFTMPMFLLHASTSNFDIFAGQWLVYALYFLRRGYAATSAGWLAAAALATALALATKPTFWFAAPGLGLVWAWVLARPWARRRSGAGGRALRAAALAAAIVLVVGTPFLWRNLLGHGYLIAPAENREAGTGASGSPADRARLLLFNSAALGVELLLPPALLPRPVAEGLDDWFAARARALGVRLPDPTLTPHAGWEGLIRHVSHRYDSNHAGFGAAFPLLLVPALLALPLAGRRLGPRRRFALAAAFLGLTYVVVLNVLTLYTVSNIRYLNEMVLLLAPLAPIPFLLLPRRLAGPLAAGLAVLLLVEMHGVVREDKQKPVDRVAVVPRDEQYAVFNGNPPTMARAARIFDQKYPPAEYPEAFVHDTGAPNFPEHTFFGADLERRAASWRPRDGEAELPGLVLTPDATLAERLGASGAAVVDRLGAGAWLLLPNDRLRVTFSVVQPTPGGDSVLRLAATVPPGRYRAPTFGFFLTTVQGEQALRRFSPDGTLDVPLEQAARGTIRVEVRDGEGGRTQERVRVERPRFMGL
jgi:hypothetical protein